MRLSFVAEHGLITGMKNRVIERRESASGRVREDLSQLNRIADRALQFDLAIEGKNQQLVVRPHHLLQRSHQRASYGGPRLYGRIAQIQDHPNPQGKISRGAEFKARDGPPILKNDDVTRG